MRIYVAGATGVLGARIVPLLVEAGHDVVGMTSSPAKVDVLTALGATPVVCDVYDHEHLVDTLVAARAADSPRLLAESIAWRASNPASVDHLERAVLDYGGVVLRYGQLYGPGTWYTDDLPDHPRVDADRAAALTLEHLTSPTGTYTLVD